MNNALWSIDGILFLIAIRLYCGAWTEQDAFRNQALELKLEDGCPSVPQVERRLVQWEDGLKTLDRCSRCVLCLAS